MSQIDIMVHLIACVFAFLRQSLSSLEWPNTNHPGLELGEICLPLPLSKTSLSCLLPGSIHPGVWYLNQNSFSLWFPCKLAHWECANPALKPAFIFASCF